MHGIVTLKIFPFYRNIARYERRTSSRTCLYCDPYGFSLIIKSVYYIECRAILQDLLRYSFLFTFLLLIYEPILLDILSSIFHLPFNYLPIT